VYLGTVNADRRRRRQRRHQFFQRARLIQCRRDSQQHGSARALTPLRLGQPRPIDRLRRRRGELLAEVHRRQ